MKLRDIIIAQGGEKLTYSFWNHPSGMCAISVTTRKHGTFRFLAPIDYDVSSVKVFTEKYIQDEIENDCGVIKFDGEYIQIK